MVPVMWSSGMVMVSKFAALAAGAEMGMAALMRLSRAETIATLIWEDRYSLLTAALAGFGRAIAEVGAVIIVGGNIDRVTRVMTTTIALETSKGDLALALALGTILIGIAIAINAAVALLRRTAAGSAYA